MLSARCFLQLACAAATVAAAQMAIAQHPEKPIRVIVLKLKADIAKWADVIKRAKVKL